MANKGNKDKPDVRVEIVVPRGGPVQPANHFIVAFTNDEFALDSIYVHPYDLHIAKQKAEEERKVPGTLVGRIAFSYSNAVKLRDNLNEMIGNYEARKK